MSSPLLPLFPIAANHEPAMDALKELLPREPPDPVTKFQFGSYIDNWIPVQQEGVAPIEIESPALASNLYMSTVSAPYKSPL